METAEACWQKAEAARLDGRAEAAAAAYRCVLALAPGFGSAHAHLLLVLEAPDAGERAVRRAIALAPDEPLLRFNLANVLGRLHRPETATAYRRALGLDPGLAEAWLNLGDALQRSGALGQAARMALRVIALSPLAEAWNNLGTARSGQGRMEEAHRAYRRALALKPGYAEAMRNLLCLGLYLDDDEGRAGEDASAFVRRYGPRLAAAKPQSPAPADPERALRIGLISSDLRNHPIGMNLSGFFEHRDRRRTWLAAYDTGGFADPAVAWFRSNADLWRSVGALSDRDIAERIRLDRIDVLVSLGGRFDLNRPLVAAFRPAPVQVVMHDGGASGMGEGTGGKDDDPPIAAWITDRWLHPEGARAGGDRLLRLPVFYNFLRFDRPPPVHRPDPAGALVLGSFSNPAKLSPRVLAAWGRILERLPEARLVLKYRAVYGDPEVQARVRSLIAKGGGDPSRLVFASSPEPIDVHLERYGAIDLALDPFPFSGATTSFEALSMGVPVLTCPGRAAIGRTTLAILGPLGLDELVAGSEEDYVDRAVLLARDRGRLERLRGEIPRRLRASPLLDGKAYAAELEQAFRQLWGEWCRKAGASGLALG
jgi:protein O-GlcNAc transferase